MAPGTLSKRLQRFITRSISSVEQIDVLLLLRREPSRPWSAHEISRELRSTPQSIASRLQALRHHGLLRADGERYRYDPSKHDDVVAELQEEYDVRRGRVIEAIFARSIDTMHSFADAFRLGEDDDDR